MEKRERLSLVRISDGLRIGTKKNGVQYSVRDDRRRYFFPDEWDLFIDSIKDKKM